MAIDERRKSIPEECIGGLPHLPFGTHDLKAFPQAVIDAARRDLPGIEWVGET